MRVKIGINKNTVPMENLAVLFPDVSSEYYCIWHLVCDQPRIENSIL